MATDNKPLSGILAEKISGTFLICTCLAVFETSSAVAQSIPIAAARFASPTTAVQYSFPLFAPPSEMAEAQLAYIRAALKPTDAQKPLWDAYASLIMKNALEMDRTFREGTRSGAAEARQQWPNAIESLEQEQSFHAEMVRRIAQLLEVERPLYGALSPVQKKVADVLLSPDLVEY